MGLDREQALKIARQYREAVAGELDIVSMWLYGSCARDSAGDMSDIDIAVVFRDIESPLETALRLMQLRRSIDSRIEPFPIRLSDWNNENPLAWSIMHEGVEVVG